VSSRELVIRVKLSLVVIIVIAVVVVVVVAVIRLLSKGHLNIGSTHSSLDIRVPLRQARQIESTLDHAWSILNNVKCSNELVSGLVQSL
jgi:hypothetical protein